MRSAGLCGRLPGPLVLNGIYDQIGMVTRGDYLSDPGLLGTSQR